MPDKPKRRKNNKNKRKNKGQYQQNNNTSNATEKSKQTSVEQGDMKAYDDSTVQHGEFVDEVTKVSSTAAEGTNIEQIINDSITETDELASNIGTKENENKDLLDKYKVESPEKPIKNKRKLRTEFKSKSLDNDNQPIIVEILDDIDEHEPKNELFQVNTSNILISECEPDIEWEKTDDLKELMHDEHPVPGALSITTIPLNIAECEEIKSMSPEEEKSLRQYLKSLNLSTNIMDSDSLEAKTELDQIIKQEIKQRAKKGSAEVSFIPRPGPSRSLHVIDEEVSGESSAASCRHSFLSDKKSDNEELEDDVFYPAKDVKLKMCSSNKQKSCGNLIPQECIRVDAQIKDPGITEAKGTWTTTTIEKMTGAEIVYLTDSSSSTSSIYDNNDGEENTEESDVSVRIITPTIEVVDTDNFLKNNFASVPIKSESDNKFRDIEEHECNKKSINTLYHEKDQSEIDDYNNCKENHEIVVLSTDNINTDLYVKEIDTLCIENHSIPSINEKEESQNKTSEPKVVDNYDLEIKVLKCELNVAINNLINEVVSDSDTTQDIQNDSFVRQDSSSSVDSSQCTAKYNPKFSSLNDVSSTVFDDIDKNSDRKLLDVNNSHVKDVIENIEDSNLYRGIKTNFVQSLRDICLETIYKLPYGEQILEELASVSERLQKINDQTGSLISLSKHTTNNLDKNKVQNPVKTNTFDKKNMIPPPLQPRQSSLKIICDDTVNVIPTKSETKRYCLSPSQKMLIDKLNTSIVTKTTDSLEENKKCADKNSTPDIAKDNTFGIPFKSQTGSRLLALLRNPSLAVNSKEQQISEDNKKLGYSKNIPPFYKTCTKNEQNNITSISEDLSIKQNEERYSSKYFKPKPIPPPKPKTFSSSYYESDESSNFVENSFKSTKNHKQYFHFSTGNLNQEIEDDISCIQNMHRHFNDVYKEVRQGMFPRRPSLPKDLTDRQMEYICQKEKEVEAEIYRLETEQIRTCAKRGPRAPMLVDKESPNSSLTSFNRIRSSQSHGVLPSLINPDPGKLSSVFSKSQEELLRNKMYSEYVSQMAEREERKQKKIIKITKTPGSLKNNTYSKSSSELNIFDSQANNRIEKEFIDKAKERWSKLGIKDPETEDESAKNYYREPKVVEHKIKVIDSGEEKDVQKLPNHLQDFVMFTAKDKSDKMDTPETVMIAPTFKARSTSPAVWSPGVPPSPAADSGLSVATPPPPPPPPIWTPNNTTASPLTQRKAFRPVHFEESPPTRRKFENTEQNGCASGSESESRLRTSQSAPVTGLNSLGNSRLPKAQNPTVTLLQKAREGQLSRANNHQQQDRDPRLPRDRPSPPFGDPVHALRRGYVSEGEGERREQQGARKMTDTHKKIDGVGPITKDGMPVTLRSEVKDPSRWYKKMYDTIHKNKYDNDYVTIRYKSRRDEPPRVSSSRSQYAYFDPRSGYLSEPEGGLSRLTSGTWSDAYDSDVTTGPRRRTASVQEGRCNDVTSPYLSNNKYSTLASTRVSQEVYKSPGKIENYTPGKSSVVDKESKQWWDEVMDIFDGQNISSTTSLPSKEKKDITSAILSKSNMARALKESGYESDSTLVFKRREDVEVPLSPAERRAAYRDLQAGGEPPLRGFRSPAPPRTETDSAPEPPRRMQHSSFSDSESPSRRYVESDVNIHYRCPVRQDPLPLVPERELARQQAEHMKRLYREQKRNKYLQELQDMQSRRHQDNFMPSQKTIVPLNRYDEPEKIIARALYTFNGQTSRELSFRKGDIINVRRQIDNNWYEGEIHGRIGLFPYNYVELLKGDVTPSPKKPVILEGRARAKFDFTAQTNLELPLKKGELVVLTRRIDHNWWEGRLGNKMGIFPDSYVTILQEPSQSKSEPQPIPATDKPVASPAAHGLVNGDKRSLGAHSYTPQPNSAALANGPPATEPLMGYSVKGSHTAPSAERGHNNLNNTEPLYVDTNAEAVPYRAMYKYRPQNPDELEMNEGDTVYVLEKCDDGWYVGSSQRTGRFGTFPGNYVERI